MTASEPLDGLMRGFVPLDELAASLRLDRRQRLRLAAASLGLEAWRHAALPFCKRRWQRFVDGLREVKGVTMEIEDHGLTPGPDNHYLSRAEVERFARRGVLEPFRVLSEADARALRDDVYDLFEREPDRPMYIGEQAGEIFARHGTLGLNYWGMYRALDHAPLREVLTSAPVTHRVASLLGPDVICWRNQLFEKAPGDQGTIWHQSSLFQESSRGHKLKPVPGTPAPLAQLTVWIALTDVTVENGAMRIVPGSFSDGSLERFYDYAASHQMEFMARLDRVRARIALKAVLFTSGQFVRSQAVLDAFAEQFPEFFAELEPLDLTMKAGEAALFTSLNVHGSYPNVSTDSTRLALAGRYTATSTQVYPDMPVDYYPTPEGYRPFPTAPLLNILAHGCDRYGHNRLLGDA